MDHKLITKSGLLPDCIEERITKADLDRRLVAEKSQGFLNSAEQCYRSSIQWYMLSLGYANPYNIFTPHSELLLLQKKVLSKQLSDSQLIFYGVGTGDTEIAMVDATSTRKDTYIIGVDVNKEFLQTFAVSLRNKLFERPNNIYYKAINGSFEQVSSEDLKSPKENNIHVCLGGTVGNFEDQKGLFDMFARLAQQEDSLIIAFQTNKHLKMLFEKYKNNPLYNDFVLNYLPTNERVLDWRYDAGSGKISAYHRDVEVFRSIKYDPNKFSRLIESCGFRMEEEFLDVFRNTCIQKYLKV